MTSHLHDNARDYRLYTVVHLLLQDLLEICQRGWFLCILCLCWAQ